MRKICPLQSDPCCVSGKKEFHPSGLLSELESRNNIEFCGLLIKKLENWTDILSLPTLGQYGITASDVEAIVARTGNKNNPVRLEPEEIRLIIEMQL